VDGMRRHIGWRECTVEMDGEPPKWYFIVLFIHLT
jgi:hypothetical protein